MSYVVAGEHDFLMNSINSVQVPRTRFTQVYIPAGLNTVTRINYSSLWDSMIQSTSLIIFIFIFIIGSVLIFISWYFKIGDTKDINILVMMRLILGTPLINLPKYVSTRIFFATMLIIFIVLNSIIPGNLISSFLSEAKGYNVENFSDLQKLNYKVSILGFMKEYFDFSDLNVTVREKGVHCYQIDVGVNEACLDTDIYLKNINKKLYHVPENNLIPIRRTFLYRRDLPLFNKINEVHLRIMSSGFITHWLEEIKTKNYINHRDDFGDSIAWKPLTIDDLFPAFILIIVNLTIAIIVCFVEVMIFKLKKKKKRAFYVTRIN